MDCSPSEKRLFIEKDHHGLSILRQTELLGIARSTAYYVPTIHPEDHTFMRRIDEIYTRCPFYGSRRIAAMLQRQGFEIGRDRVCSLMKKMGIAAIFPKPNTSKKHPEHRIYPYLLQDTKICRPNHVWGSDITYIRLAAGFMYLVAIIDWFSRFVLSFRLSNTLEDSFCIEALEESLATASPEIHNSDQGSQFTGNGFISVLEHKNIRISMDGRGRALDNVFTERLWRSLKYEEVYLKHYENPMEAYTGIEEYFHLYNFERPHQSLDYKTPAEIYFG